MLTHTSMPAQIVARLRDEPLAAVTCREVGLAHVRAAAPRHDGLGYRLRAIGGGAVREQDGGSLGRERLGDRAPDAAARAGDDRAQASSRAASSRPRPTRTGGAPSRTPRITSLTFGSLPSARAIDSFVAW